MITTLDVSAGHLRSFSCSWCRLHLRRSRSLNPCVLCSAATWTSAQAARRLRETKKLTSDLLQYETLAEEETNENRTDDVRISMTRSCTKPRPTPTTTTIPLCLFQLRQAPTTTTKPTTTTTINDDNDKRQQHQKTTSTDGLQHIRRHMSKRSARPRFRHDKELSATSLHATTKKRLSG
jgi:hypothetical protein